MGVSFKLHEKRKRCSMKKHASSTSEACVTPVATQHTSRRWQDVVRQTLLQNLARRSTGASNSSAPSKLYLHEESISKSLARDDLRLARYQNPVDVLTQFKSSFIVFLFSDAFLCRNITQPKAMEGNAQAYDESSSAFLLALDRGVIPYGLTELSRCFFYEGHIVVDLWDYRHTLISAPSTSAALPRDNPIAQPLSSRPHIRRLLLREPPSQRVEHLDAQVAQVLARAPTTDAASCSVQVEAQVLPHVAGAVCWDPSPDVFHVATALHASSVRGQNETLRKCGLGDAYHYYMLGKLHFPYKRPLVEMRRKSKKPSESVPVVASAEPTLPPAASGDTSPFLLAAKALRTQMHQSFKDNLQHLLPLDRSSSSTAVSPPIVSILALQDGTSMTALAKSLGPSRLPTDAIVAKTMELSTTPP
ncbi:Aste57867_15077 [Aphanomyces stellatus]|uniref:Aste57867_15077 protein n=1 Tax=Aphanomyces stellatus TaxID=120398 RepID=A0A485L3A9_9STRA|nr:hypothetical protein As57867_015021 [Aphanomyces stellatus]VFT91890.1 Aste57867_15077 [Aphanomyces stellatus]